MPFLDGLNSARPKGSAKLGLSNVRAVLAADGEPIGLEVPAASLVGEGNEPVDLIIEIGEAMGGRTPLGLGEGGSHSLHGPRANGEGEDETGSNARCPG